MLPLIAFIVVIFIIFIVAKVFQIYKVPLRFFLEGINSGFSLNEIILLWKTSKIANIEEPLSIYISMPVLSKCIAHIKSEADMDGTINRGSIQRILSKLYDFRTKIEKEADKKRGLESTRALDEGQKLRIILPGQGVFSSELVNNARDLTIKVPTQKDMITIEGSSWVGKTICVYLWRKGDARYVFDTTVKGQGVFLGKPALFLEHSSNLERAQKRNAIRAACQINANLYLLKDKNIDYNVIETKAGFRCILEDISEKGASIRIGGKGIPKILIKLQFQLDNRLVIMFGIVRTVEYNENFNQSRLHFECTHIEESMKNIVLSYVYNILPENEKEIYDAIKLTSDDEEADDSEKLEEEENSDIIQTEEEDLFDANIPEVESKEDEEKLEDISLDGSIPIELPLDASNEVIKKSKT